MGLGDLERQSLAGYRSLEKESAKALIHGDHAGFFLSCLHDGVDLVNLVFSDQDFGWPSSGSKSRLQQPALSGPVEV